MCGPKVTRTIPRADGAISSDYGHFRDRAGVAYLVGTCVLVVGALVLGWLVTARIPDQLTSVSISPISVETFVIEESVDFNTEAVATGEYRAAAPVTSSGLSGTVTRVPIAPGGILTAGDAVYEVDNLTVTAYDDEQVLYRSLKQGDRGEDVAGLQRVLNGLVAGANLEVDGRFGSGTAEAVREFSRTIGARPTAVFDPRWMVHLPTSEYRVDSVAVQVGTPAPQAGTRVLTSEAQLVGVSITSQSAGPADGEYEFVYAGEAIPVARRGGDWAVEDASTPAFSDVLAPHPSEEGDSGVALADTTMTTLKGRTRLTNPTRASVVAPAALVTSQDGATCLVAADDTSTPIPVAVVGVTVDGRAIIESRLTAGTAVLLNPVDVAPQITCV